MRRIIVFNHVTLDGYFTDANRSMDWAHGKEDAEWNAFVAENAKGGGELLFGRITYDLMASFWPTPMAVKMMPTVAAQMNGLPKVVFSRTLGSAAWSNTTVVRGDLVQEVQRMKAAPGADMVIMGSGTIVAQLTQAGLIDEYQLVLNPIVLGKGRTLFDGVSSTPVLKPTRTRTFGNGNVLLCYEPVQ